LRDCEPFRWSGDPDGDRPVRLTPEELKILAASASGLTVSEVSATLGYPRGTVELCLEESIRKLRARSKLEAVLIALRHRLIDVP